MDLYKAIKRDIGLLILAVVILQFVANSFNIGVDSSDLDGFNRSNLEVHTDYATGVQYLSTSGGALIPRLNEKGKPVTLVRVGDL